MKVKKDTKNDNVLVNIFVGDRIKIKEIEQHRAINLARIFKQKFPSQIIEIRLSRF